jgi:hypothetical protein
VRVGGNCDPEKKEALDDTFSLVDFGTTCLVVPPCLRKQILVPCRVSALVLILIKVWRILPCRRPAHDSLSLHHDCSKAEYRDMVCAYFYI